MIIGVRDQDGNLLAKDMLDIDYDMSVVEDDNKYFVNINKKYRLEDEFIKREDAEKRLKRIVNDYNVLEAELRKYE